MLAVAISYQLVMRKFVRELQGVDEDHVSDVRLSSYSQVFSIKGWPEIADTMMALFTNVYILVLSLILTLPFQIGGQPTGPQLHTSDQAKVGLLWTSIGLAVLTSALQGLVTTVVTIAEDQGMWTFRFRVARYEHYWWVVISMLLFISFVLIVISFLSGNTSDSLGVLALSTATAVAVVRYAVPAWRNRHFIENRWQAWTGKSRTAIKATFADKVGDKAQWRRIAAIPGQSRAIVPAPSDEWGWALKRPPGLWQDPTALLARLGENRLGFRFTDGTRDWPLGPCVYDDGFHHVRGSVSLLWGEQEGFRKRVSRAVNSMPIGLLQARPFTIDGYNGEGLCLALGILGRSKGLDPRAYVFDHHDRLKQFRGVVRERPGLKITTELENTSVWSPRPNKVMRSYYKRAVEEQFGELSESFCGAATELALLMLDSPPQALRSWLRNGLDQQSMEVNRRMSQRPTPPTCNSNLTATPAQLQTLYRAGYTSMIISLNYYHAPHNTITTRAMKKPSPPPVRPDLICFALLYLAEGAVTPTGDRFGPGSGAPEPKWWRQAWVEARLREEQCSLTANFRDAAAWLLGLQRWPEELDRWPAWPDIRYHPVYDDATIDVLVRH